MKIAVPVLAIAAIAFVAPASAMMQEEAPGVVGAEESEENPDERIRCQTRRVTGSNARRMRTCMTIAQWRELARGGNRDAQRIVGWGAGCPDPTQC
ncbi:MAG: hypothetical protein ACTS1Z_03635 [Parasphingopyxis sp.]|uniref:hypothetical protein n=1 Tax=Parasphingopyxis sp. TaxID=1920299 RepID=UPI003F9F3FD2